MATNTSRLGLLKKDTATDGNDTFNIKTMLNDNWDKIDAKVATLGPDGKVPADQVNIPTLADASTTQKGVVQLEDSVTSASTSKAATPNSVKQVNDAVVAHKADLVSHGVCGTASGTNTLTMAVTLDSSVTSYPTFMLVAFKNTIENTGAVTLNINSIGAKPIKNPDGTDLDAKSLKAGGIYQVRYDGVNFILLGSGGGGSLIKNIQSGKITYATTTTADARNIPITAVDVSKSIILVNASNDGGAGTSGTVAFFDNSEQLTVYISNKSGSNVTIHWQVIEFKSGIKNVQRGLINNTSTTGTIAVENFDTAKSYLLTKGFNNSVTSGIATEVFVEITDPQTLSYTKNTGASYLAWQLVEFI